MRVLFFCFIFILQCCDSSAVKSPFSQIIFPVKITEECVLRPFNETDANGLTMVIESNRDFLKQTMNWQDYFHSEEDSRSFISKAMDHYSRGNALSLCIDRLGNIIGMICFNEIKKDSEKEEMIGEIGYWLDQTMNGRGIMTAALKSIVKIGFNAYLLSKIFISCGTENGKSRRVAERCGFEFLHEIKGFEILYGKTIDHYLFVLDKCKWNMATEN
jgi:ribosomal-protein-serine acetyltransferase